jgi:hypothetical protein
LFALFQNILDHVAASPYKHSLRQVRWSHAPADLNKHKCMRSHMQDSDSDEWDVASEEPVTKKQNSLSSPAVVDAAPLVGQSRAFGPHAGDNCDLDALQRAICAIDIMVLRWGPAHFQSACDALEQALVSLPHLFGAG